MNTPITDRWIQIGDEFSWVEADKVSELELAANAMEEALEEVWGELRTFGEGPEGEDPIREMVHKSLAQYRALKP